MKRGALLQVQSDAAQKASKPRQGEPQRGGRLFAGRRAGRRGGEEGIPEEKGIHGSGSSGGRRRPSVTGAGVPGSRSPAEENRGEAGEAGGKQRKGGRRERAARPGL